ncbi:MAG: glycoside hydrolase family 3 N-terminal domain-containing protein [Breznakibacter sp.]
MRKLSIMALFCGLLVSPVFSQPLYKNAKQPVDLRVKDLIGRMTLEEKVGQMLCPLGWEMYEKKGVDVIHSAKFEQFVKGRHIGMLWAVYRADPWTRKTLENGLNPELAAKAGNALQRYVMDNTRLGIPIFLAEEAPHGHMAIGTTVFPSGIGMAATWSPAVIEETGKVIAKEIRLQGGHIGYGPVLDLTRDPRWSRVEETYGEDPVLSGVLGAAMVRGAGQGKLSQPFSVISTLKHFLAYGVPEGGHNGNTTIIGPRDLHENFLPPFKAAVEAGALSVMTSYNSIDGVPCTSNGYLLTDVLRDQWNFKGFVVSDLGSIEGLKGSHFIAETMEEAAVLATKAGVDSDLGGEAYRNLVNAVKSGRIAESAIDTAVARILRLKFEMGLFENPYVDPKMARQNTRTPEHIAQARRVAQQSVVLLKNDNLLPLNKDIKRVAVIGPNADNRYNMLGDYTAPQDPANIKTVLDGVRAKLKGASIEYVKGCAIRDTTTTNIDEAVAAARRSDVAIVVVGGSSARDFKTQYIETGAAVASAEDVSDMESGEGYDRATLDLLGKQLDLLKAVKATGKPVVVVYIQGRPLNMNWAAAHADALLTAWYPGQEGGNAIADVLFGDYNPAGRLPISIPRHEGQIPVYYNKKNPRGHDYVEMPAAPLYSFGYGLSYTQFEYSDLRVEKKGQHTFEVSFNIKNMGAYDGDEVVQLYLRDDYASMVQPVKQLKHFSRLTLKKGEEQIVRFTLTASDLSILNAKMEQVVEPGSFTVMVGASSDDIRLNTIIEVE